MGPGPVRLPWRSERKMRPARNNCILTSWFGLFGTVLDRIVEGQWMTSNGDFDAEQASGWAGFRVYPPDRSTVHTGPPTAGREPMKQLAVVQS
jgi:hypothetical protein